MKLIKIKSIEILTNGSLNITQTSLLSPKQIIIYKKDYKSLKFYKKIKNISNFKMSNKFYKTQYKF